MDLEEEYENLLNQVEELTKRVRMLEKRIERLEGSNVSSSKKKSGEGTPKRSKTGSNSEVGHNYLKKTIDDAKKRYEREHGK